MPAGALATGLQIGADAAEVDGMHGVGRGRWRTMTASRATATGLAPPAPICYSVGHRAQRTDGGPMPTSPPGRRPWHDDARDAHGQTALHLAARAGDSDAIRRLLAAGAAVEARDADGNTPLHRAVQAGHAAAARTLIAAGVDVDAATRFGHTPLHLAAGTRQEELAGLLVAYGADADRPIAGGRNSRPLHLAAEAGLPRLAALLLRRGADVNARNGDGQTPLDLAEGAGLPDGEGHAAVAALLRGRGAARGEAAAESPAARGFRGRVTGPGRNGRAGGRGAWD
jgi:hypothetical protein